MLAIVQARMSSSRLPGKVLKKIVGKSLLELQLERVKRSKLITKIVVATSVDSSDDVIESLCKSLSIDCTRGSMGDVLDRFYVTAKLYNANSIVRITGDCPIIDPGIIDTTINCFHQSSVDYASNVNPPTFPDGLDVEVMKFKLIYEAWEKASLLSEREHVTRYFYNNADKYSFRNIENDTDLSHLRWTVDEWEDFKLIEYVYNKLYLTNPEFNFNDVLQLFDNSPDKSNINNMFVRNEGLDKSLMNDKK